MKISELVSILERVQEHFEDCDIEIVIPCPGFIDEPKTIKSVSFAVHGAITLVAGDRPVVPA